MRLFEIPGFVGPYSQMTVDRTFLEGLAKRIVEDLELACYVSGRALNKKALDTQLVAQVVQLLDPQFVARGGLVNPPKMAIFSRETVIEYAKAPWEHDKDATELIARYVNGRTFEILHSGAEFAQQAGRAEIRLMHIVPKCEDLPYPLNLYAC